MLIDALRFDFIYYNRTLDNRGSSDAHTAGAAAASASAAPGVRKNAGAADATANAAALPAYINKLPSVHRALQRDPRRR
jgi:hypothetical protein